MNLMQEIKTYGAIGILSDEKRTSSYSVNQNSAEMFTARIMNIINPYIKYQITDGQFLVLQEKIKQLLFEYKKVQS